MNEDEKISARQFMILVMLFTIGGNILVTPSLLADEVEQDAWIVPILGVCLSLLLIWLYCSLGGRFPNMTLVEYSEEILGKWIGKIMSLLFLSSFFLLSAILLREIGDFMTIQFMPETPKTVFHVMFLLLVIAGTRMGLEPIARASEIFLPWVVVLYFTIVIFVAPQFKVENIQPVFEAGVKPIFAAVYPFFGLVFLELYMLLMFFPSVNRRAKAKRAYFLGPLFGGFMLLIFNLVSILVLGHLLVEKQAYPSLVLAKKIDVADFFQRLEVVVAVSWFLTIFFKLAICFYATVLGLSQMLKLKNYHFLAYPLGLLLLPLSIAIGKNKIQLDWFGANIWPTYTLILGFLFPLLLLVMAVIRKKGKTTNGG